MKNASRVIRGANFTYPWSERSDYFSPRQVQLMIGVSGLLVLALVALPFLLANLESRVLQERALDNVSANQIRIEAEESAPVLARQAVLDTLLIHLNSRISLRQQINLADYAVDRLMLHISELVPDGIHLMNITIQPPSARAGNRPASVTQTEELPEHIQIAHTITISGSARNAAVLTMFDNAIDQSPLFYGRTVTYQPRETTFEFIMTCRLPGTGVEITEEGS